MDEPGRAFGVAHAGNDRFHDPILSLLRGHAAHAFAETDAEPRQIGVSVDHLGDRGARVILHDLGGFAIAEVLMVELLVRVGGNTMMGGERRADKDVPVDQVGVDAAFPGEGEKPVPERLPLREFNVGQRAGLREAGVADHEMERVLAPEGEGVEPVAGHHVEKGLPELEVPARFTVQGQRFAGAITVPRQVELDRSKWKPGRRRTGLNVFEPATLFERLAQGEGAVEYTPCITPVNFESQRAVVISPGYAVAFGGIGTANTQFDDCIGRDRRSCRWVLHLITARVQCLFELSDCVAHRPFIRRRVDSHLRLPKRRHCPRQAENE